MKIKFNPLTANFDLVDGSGGGGSNQSTITFNWARSGVVPAGSWLLNDSIPSNKSGRTLSISSANVVRFFSASDSLDTYVLELYEHDGNSVNLTYKTNLTVSSSRIGNSGSISIPVTNGKQLAVKLATGSAKNIICGILPKGNT